MMVRMKAAALVLLLAFGTLQGVSVTDCPCGSLCESKNACPDEKKHESPDDCCSRTRREATENCFHLEPQTELDHVSPELDPVPVLILAVLELPTRVVRSNEEESSVFGRGLSPPSSHAPLFLLHSSFII